MPSGELYLTVPLGVNKTYVLPQKLFVGKEHCLALQLLLGVEFADEEISGITPISCTQLLLRRPKSPGALALRTDVRLLWYDARLLRR